MIRILKTLGVCLLWMLAVNYIPYFFVLPVVIGTWTSLNKVCELIGVKYE